MTSSKMLRAARVTGAVGSAVLAVSGVGFAAAQTMLAPAPAVEFPQTTYVIATPAPSPVQQPVQPDQHSTGHSLVDPAWVASAASRAGIPAAALRAYADAQLRAPKGCDIGWATLAGIGWIESQHGTLQGRTLGEDGHSSAPILGPELDGDPFAAIPATPRSSRWHGNRDWDHAVGPMQFIPSTWDRWGTDGDGDGVADPNDLDDAAAAAAAYLCADGHDLRSGEGWTAAVFSYNHDESYVASVHRAASTYADRTR